MIKTSLLRKLIPIVLLTLPAACGYNRDQYLGLEDKGILPLSSNDAFLGSNLFLAKEMEADAYLYNFFRMRGVPAAIEIDEDSSGERRMLMYYGQENSVYIAHPNFQDGVRRWVIRGPYQMEWKDARELKHLSRTGRQDALFFIGGSYKRLPEPRAETPRQVVRIVTPPTPVPTPRPRRPVKRVTAKPTEAPTPTGPDPKEFHKLNSDQRAILIAQGYAPRADNGDIVHIVKYENETLGRISRWYTKAENNKQEIASFNGLGPDDALAQGTQVRVPLKLVTQDKAMPKDFE